MAHALCLAQLFTNPMEASGPGFEDEAYRERVLGALAGEVAAFATENETVAFFVAGGRIFAERHPEIKGLVIFDVYPNDTLNRGRFWMNESSVAEEILAARRRAARRVELIEIMTNDSPIQTELPLGFRRREEA